MAVGETTGSSRPTDRVLRLVGAALLIARYGLVVVLASFGAMKFTYYESRGVSPLVAYSPFLSWVFDAPRIAPVVGTPLRDEPTQPLYSSPPKGAER
jgi:uncharacterized membrane protein YkgB